MYPLLQIENLQIAFENHDRLSTVVHNSDLFLNRGEILAIVGESGSGKSVTALSILQLLPAAVVRYPSGNIWFSPNGKERIDLLKENEHTLRSIRGNKIAMIFQEPMTSLNPVFTCGVQVMEAIRVHQKCTGAEAKKKTLALFQKVRLPDPEQMMDRYPHQISGGQKQRVMIAMAMSCEPDILICDEPTTALDVTVQKTILELIRELQLDNQMGVIFITHDLGVVSELADRAMVMQEGYIVEEGKVQDLFLQPQHPYTKALLACRPVLHPKGVRLPVVADFLSEDVSAEIIASNAPQEPLAKKELLLKASQVSVWFPQTKNFWGKPTSFSKAVDEVDLDIYKGETVGLVGESGCGKTTLGRTLLQLIPCTKGSIQFKGSELSSASPQKIKTLRKEIQLIFQDPYSSLNPRIKIGEAIQEPLQVHGILKSAAARKEKAVALLEKVNMKAEHLDRYPHEFSGGQRQRIVIARALALDPEFLVCDESVSALDVSVQAQVLNLLNDLKKEMGFTILFISHDLSVVRYISDRLLVMNKGRIIESGAAEDVYSNPKEVYTQQLLSAIPGRKFTKTGR